MDQHNGCASPQGCGILLLSAMNQHLSAIALLFHIYLSSNHYLILRVKLHIRLINMTIRLNISELKRSIVPLKTT